MFKIKKNKPSGIQSGDEKLSSARPEGWKSPLYNFIVNAIKEEVKYTQIVKTSYRPMNSIGKIQGLLAILSYLTRTRTTFGTHPHDVIFSNESWKDALSFQISLVGNLKRKTKHFRKGAKVYVTRLHIGERSEVLGWDRIAKRKRAHIVNQDWISLWRLEIVYDKKREFDFY